MYRHKKKQSFFLFNDKDAFVQKKGSIYDSTMIPFYFLLLFYFIKTNIAATVFS